MMRKVKFLKHAAVAILLALGIHGPPEASAGLKDRGAPNTTTGFPMWYRDNTNLPPLVSGTPLELCLSNTLSPAVPTSPMCVLLPDATYTGGTVGNPGGNFPGESFYFIADGDFTTADPTNTYKAVYRAALEATYANGTPIPGTEMVFMRIRFRMDNLLPGAVYTITHPYGVKQLTAEQDPKVPTLGFIDYTEDLLPPTAAQFDGPIFGNIIPPGFTIDVSPFLFAANAPVVVGQETFIGDPNISTTVVGSPFNFVEVKDANGNILLRSDLFQVAGKIATLGNLILPPSTDFGAVSAGTTTAPKTVTIANTAQRAGQLLTVNSITFTGDATNFALAPSTTVPCPATAPFNLNPGEFCNVDVVFTPTAPAGAKAATMTFNTTDPAIGAKTVSFTGTATPPAPVQTVSLTANPASPQNAGVASVTFNGTATGGVPPYEYQFWFKKAGGWGIVKPFSVSGSSYVWTPAATDPAGDYIVHVEARSAGSTATRGEAFTSTNYTLLDPAGPTSVTLASSLTSPQGVGVASIDFTATAAGGTGTLPYEYQFWVKSGSAWTCALPFPATPTATPNNVFNWAAAALLPGNYRIQVEARRQGSTAPRGDTFLSIPFTINAAPTAVALSTTTPGPFVAGTTTSITFKGTATGGFGPYEYQFWRKTGGIWKQVQQFGPSPTYTWNPTVADIGDSLVQVEVRRAGSTAARGEAFKTASYRILDTTAPTGVTLTRNGSTFTATATGGTGPVQYQFWHKRNGIWSTVAQFPQTSNTWTDPAPVPGNDIVQVEARSAVSTAPRGEVFFAMPYTIP